MNNAPTMPSVPAVRMHRVVNVDIEPLLQYLECLGHGSWAVFDEAVKAVAPDAWSSYDFADRLSAQGFVEFDWFDDSSWQFCQPTLVEAIGPSTGFLGERDSLISPEIAQDSWAIFAASRAASLALLAGYPSDTWLVRQKSVTLGSVRLNFDRVVILDPSVKTELSRSGRASVLDSAQLRHYLEMLPDLKAAAHYWCDGGVPEAMEIVRLEEAWRTQFFRAATGDWEYRQFDRSPGMWRTEGSVRRYYLVSEARGPKAAGNEAARTVDILRVAPELGRWFEALKSRTAGKARIKSASRTLDIELGSAVIDLPVIYERWLALSGCRRIVLTQRPKVLRFTNILAADAATLVKRLHLVLEY